MPQRSILVSCALLITMLLFGGAALLSSGGLWGVNHLKFLPRPFEAVYLLCFALVGALLFFPRIATRIHLRVVALCDLGLRFPYRMALLVALCLGILFWCFRLQTQFLGDGSTLLSLFGTKDFFFFKWTEVGAIAVVRGVQSLLGQYTRTSALHALQVLSVASGVMTVYNLVWIAKRLSHTPAHVLVNVSCLLLSGTLLLFFGYTEFYHMVWAAATTFVNLALRYWQSRKGLGWVLLAFSLTVAMHLQVLYWAPAVGYMVHWHLVQRSSRGRWPRLFLIATLSFGAAAFGALIWLYLTRYDIRAVFLPAFFGPPSAPDYAVFTFKHLLDIVNELLLVAPAVLMLLVAALFQRATWTPEARFFAWMSVGSALFLLVVNPVFGMGRDWDLMSLTVFAPVLLLLTRIPSKRIQLLPGQSVAILIVCLMATTLFLSTTIEVKPSEERFLSMLDYYGSKDRAGWTILSKYYADRMDVGSKAKVDSGLTRYFPDEVILAKAYEEFRNQNYRATLSLAQQLYRKDSTCPDYMQIYANVLGRLGQYDRAVELYKGMLQLRPFFAQGHKELGQVYIQAGRPGEAVSELTRAWKLDPTLSAAGEYLALAYTRLSLFDSAEVVARKLTEIGGDDAGVHLIRMVICLTRGDRTTARTHWEQYVALGAQRADYDNIRSYYGPYFK